MLDQCNSFANKTVPNPIKKILV